MESKLKIFHAKSEKVAFDRDHRRILTYNVGQYDKAVLKGKLFFNDLDNAREQASKIKEYCLQEFEHLLVRFEKNARGNGCEVEWASGSDDVLKIIGKVIASEDVRTVVKMKSMLSEELEINHFLKKNKVEAFETDLGEFIVQLAGEKPYHILTPAMHKSKENVAELFNQKFGLEPGSTPEVITDFVRSFLRDKFMSAQMGITGANFLIAETGSVGLTENEGNGMLTFSWPKTLIVIAGIERIVPELGDLDLFWPLLAVYGTGQHVSAYNSILSGPAKATEGDGPERMIVILFDGGRTRLFQDLEMNPALKCIRCGACSNVCPVYKNIGGHTYQTTYTGPIGSVISMYLDGCQDMGFLNFASSLCGKCTDACPVKIPLHKLLLTNRHKIVESSDNLGVERFFFRNYKKYMLKRRRLERVNTKWKNRAMNTIGQKVWGPRREPLVFAKESFHQTWKKKEF
ncbi:MAG: lactate utilization protein B [Bacteroidia bacterium]|nr:lactate utilization protein B [Bacteroidia bacterium]